MGRTKQEIYKEYRERKLAEMQAKRTSGNHCVLVVGLVFLIISIVFTVIWYTNFYNITG
jgi:uncharacterized integral membrane protein